MGVFSRLEGGLDSAFDRAAGAVFRAPIEPAQIAKRAEKQMIREKLVGAGKQYAPTLYTVLVNTQDNHKLFGFYPTMAAEIETYLVGKGTQNGLKFDGRPLVRFIVDDKLKSGRFDVIAENVAAPIITQLRDEEMEFYGLKEPDGVAGAGAGAGAGAFDDESGIAGISAVLPSGEGGGGAVRAAAANAAPLAAAAPAGAAPTPHPHPRGGGRSSLANLPEIASASTALGHARLTDLNARKSYALTKTTVVLGRDVSCDITLDDANISRRHVQLSQDVVGTWKLTDLNSTNGTQLNDAPVASALLRDGDRIGLGVTILEFREDR
jgi:hypothetical protein